jgi:hypothetical protein
MTSQTSAKSVNHAARVAGWLYLALAPLGFFSQFAYSGLVVAGNAAATASKVAASEPLLRLGIVSALLLNIVNIFVVLALYRLLKPAGQRMATLMVVFILAAVPIGMLNQLNLFAVLALVHSAGGVSGFTAGQVQSWVPLILGLHQLGVNIVAIFWGLWLFPMGYLVFKSGFLPRLLGVLLMIGCFGYLIDSFAAFLFPSFGINVASYTFWGELLLALWLVIKGVNVEQWEKRALVPSQV